MSCGISNLDNIVTSPLTSRYELAELCNDLKLTNYAVEVGTDKAVFAAAFLSRWRGKQLVCIDPWEPCRESPWDRLPDLLLATYALGQFVPPNRIRMIRSRNTPEVVGQIARNLSPVDFVYIDGDHTTGVTQDVPLWAEAMTGSSILAGHDFHDLYPAVVGAVSDLANAENLPINVIWEPTGNSWYLMRHWKSEDSEDSQV